MIKSEEEFLSKIYGEEYEKYCNGVPRIIKLFWIESTIPIIKLLLYNQNLDFYNAKLEAYISEQTINLYMKNILILYATREG